MTGTSIAVRPTAARPRIHRRVVAALLALIGTCACAACGTSSGRSASEPAPAAATRADVLSPSSTTKMICANEAQHDLSATLGVDTSRPVVATWHAGTYSCRYVYRDGTFTLAVQQLADMNAAERYFDTLAVRLGRRQLLTGLGQRATSTANGTVVVQKDNEVLSVDPRGLPQKFGNRADTPANVALSVAATIMGCWTES